MSHTENEHSPVEQSSVSLEHTVFQGLSPRLAHFEEPTTGASGTFRKGLFSSIPLLMTGTLATGVVAAPGLGHLSPEQTDTAGGQTEESDARPSFSDRLHTALLPIAQMILSATGSELPATYTVTPGDTISGIADRFGVPTPAILTLNGLSWNAVVHEGQVLKLSPEPTKKRQASPARVMNNGYLVQNGESASQIADRVGISTQALLAHNNLSSDAVIYAGQLIKLPGVTKEVVDRARLTIPTIAAAPTIVAASLDAEVDEVTVEEEEKPPAFDAADIELAEKPELVVVKVPEKKAVVTPPPAPKVSPPAQKTSTPAPAAPAPTAPAEVQDTAASAPSGVGQPVDGSITPLNDERRGNAQIIVSMGRELGVPDYGIVIALATAMQESSLRNIQWGDRDSLGLYQQRPSTGWGSAEQIMDPAYSTRLFFGGPSNPNKGFTRGLLDISGWSTMALTDAAQRVQISAYPKAYAKWEASAWAWLYELS